MTYHVTFTAPAVNEMRKLGSEAKKRIYYTVIEKLSKNPKDYPQMQGKFKGLRKLRVGDYRVLFAVIETEVRIARVEHRSKIYD